MAPRVEDHAIIDSPRDSITALPPITLILGGTRSGKSAHAESLITRGIGVNWNDALYIATAQIGDAEMAVRIHDHKARRGANWTTIEEPLALACTLREKLSARRPALVDCLTLWLTNVMLSDHDPYQEVAELIGSLAELAGPVVFVSNEVGLGIVPNNALARAFRDHAGRLNQHIAAAAQRVDFIAAGLPVTLKNEYP
jgi:adenosylcobinamide kinase/adenosylcobinamide-phosphate guanylyltransferase